jgi:protein-disulfide isomerase
MPTNGTNDTPRSFDLSDPVSARDHLRGAASAKVILVEYGDFECPFCARAEPVVRALLARFDKDLGFVFRHNPRVHDHPHARKAAEAAEAAGDQGKFWEMHDLLFSRQSALEEKDLIAYAKGLGLDTDRFAQALRSGAHHERVHGDELSGVRSHVISTPTFFVNGARFNDTPDQEHLGAAVEAALKAAKS